MRVGFLCAGVLALAACSPGRPLSPDAPVVADGAVEGGQVVDGLPDVLVCPPGTTRCGGACVDLDTDAANCGACGNACGNGECCSDGLCQSDCVLPPGFMDCGGSMVDINSSNDHCGACDSPCDTSAGFTCMSGSCSCVGGMTDCSGVCVNTKIDPQNCGSCGTACGSWPSSPQWCNGQYVQIEPCTNGMCLDGCPPPLSQCCGSCIDLQSSNEHCGTCTAPSSCDTASGFSCQAGSCSCLPWMTDCSGACVDLNSDWSNCGVCGCTCPVATVCNAGTCTLGCPSGQIPCPTGAYLPAPSCPGGQWAVEACVDPQSNSNNCGACGTVCPANTSCGGGTCV